MQRSSVLGNKIEMEITDLVEKNTSLLRLGLHLEFNDARHRIANHLQRNIDRSKYNIWQRRRRRYTKPPIHHIFASVISSLLFTLYLNILFDFISFIFIGNMVFFFNEFHFRCKTIHPFIIYCASAAHKSLWSNFLLSRKLLIFQLVSLSSLMWKSIYRHQKSNQASKITKFFLKKIAYNSHSSQNVSLFASMRKMFGIRFAVHWEL